MSSGWDTPQQVPGQPLPQQPPLALPVHGAWDGAWQDERGQWHYPYAAHAPAPPFPPVQAIPTTTIIAPELLEPVGPPRYYGPAPAARDPRQTTMAAVITFVALIIALWAILGFMGSMSNTLSSISAGNDKLKVQLASANEGLAMLEVKTANLNAMAENTGKLKGELQGIDKNMGSMLAGVDRIAAGMQAMDTSLTSLDGQLSQVNDINGAMAADLAKINGGLGQQKTNVGKMRADVVATSAVLQQVPGRLKATNGRLLHTNNVVNFMGCQGILNNLQVAVYLGPIKNGTAKVIATVIPPGAWGTKADGTPCGP